MFTGIIECTGVIIFISEEATNKVFWIQSSISQELKIDQSLSHNGVCLTVEEVHQDTHRVTAVKETLLKTNLGQWITGTQVNLERSLQMTGRIDGHLVQGHVDCNVKCSAITDLNGSWQFDFAIDKKDAALVIEKGSISINGISLTIFNVTAQSFTVTIIPYTFKHTNMNQLKAGDLVNIEFDLIGKYVQRTVNMGNKHQ